MKSKEKALLVAELSHSKKADDIVILDMKKVSDMTDYFVIVTASSAIRAQAIADNIERGLAEHDEKLSAIEGYREANWILIDAFDVLVHIFDAETRSFYNLESLWGDASKVRPCRKKPAKKTGYKKTTKRK